MRWPANGQVSEEFVRNWSDGVREYGLRYRDKVKGWWTDDGLWEEHEADQLRRQRRKQDDEEAARAREAQVTALVTSPHLGDKKRERACDMRFVASPFDLRSYSSGGHGSRTRNRQSRHLISNRGSACCNLLLGLNLYPLHCLSCTRACTNFSDGQQTPQVGRQVDLQTWSPLPSRRRTWCMARLSTTRGCGAPR